MLYSLATEPLMHRLRQDLRGVYFLGCDVPVKQSAYADDVKLMVNTQRDIDVLVSTVDLFDYLCPVPKNWGRVREVRREACGSAHFTRRTDLKIREG